MWSSRQIGNRWLPVALMAEVVVRTSNRSVEGLRVMPMTVASSWRKSSLMDGTRTPTMADSNMSRIATSRPPASVIMVSPVRHGALRLPCSNRSRTREAPTPTNISTKSEPDMLKNGTPASPATALASSVLPEPGGPSSSAPLGMRPPNFWNLAGSFRNSMTSCSSCFASSQPETSLNVTRVCDSMSTRALLLPKRIAAEPPPCIWRSMNIQATKNSNSGSHVNSTDSQFTPGACTMTCAFGFAARVFSASNAPSPRKFVLNDFTGTLRPATVSVTSAFNSPSTVRVSSTNVTLSRLPFSTSCTKRAYGMSIRCDVSRLPAYMR